MSSSHIIIQPLVKIGPDCNIGTANSSNVSHANAAVLVVTEGQVDVVIKIGVLGELGNFLTVKQYLSILYTMLLQNRGQNEDGKCFKTINQF
jgi:hypothetical protein